MIITLIGLMLLMLRTVFEGSEILGGPESRVIRGFADPKVKQQLSEKFEKRYPSSNDNTDN
ncbi:hypothetical protein J25TS5_16060 [Paenibacillus faecis]|nr:hypothetical protein J25TS5_16060 [Paenibacillus faecis]